MVYEGEHQVIGPLQDQNNIKKTIIAVITAS